MLGRQEESESLSGRVPIWLELTNYARARPLQGYGYEAFWTAKHIEAVSEELQWPLREAHNAYLDCTLSVGLVGAAALLLSVFLAMQRAAVGYRATGDMGFAFTLGMLAFAVVSACLESGVASPNLITLIAGSGVAMLAFYKAGFGQPICAQPIRWGGSCTASPRNHHKDRGGSTTATPTRPLNPGL